MSKVYKQINSIASTSSVVFGGGGGGSSSGSGSSSSSTASIYQEYGSAMQAAGQANLSGSGASTGSTGGGGGGGSNSCPAPAPTGGTGTQPCDRPTNDPIDIDNNGTNADEVGSVVAIIGAFAGNPLLGAAGVFLSEASGLDENN